MASALIKLCAISAEIGVCALSKLNYLQDLPLQTRTLATVPGLPCLLAYPPTTTSAELLVISSLNSRRAFRPLVDEGEKHGPRPPRLASFSAVSSAVKINAVASLCARGNYSTLCS